MTSAPDAARIMIEGIEKDRLHVYVGKDSRLMSVAVKIAPRRAIRFVERQMAKHVGAMVPGGA